MIELCDACGGTGKPISALPCICGGSGKLVDAYNNLRQHHYKLEQELLRERESERKLSIAYVRLRSMIPGAFDTPIAPRPDQIFEITEAALKKALGK